jgi:hypothetical protein
MVAVYTDDCYIGRTYWTCIQVINVVAVRGRGSEVRETLLARRNWTARVQRSERRAP